jgi:hypothetical protein
MSSEQEQPPLSDPKVAAQVNVVVDAFREAGISIGYATTRDGGLDYMFQEDVILVRDEYLEQVRVVVGGGQTDDGLIDGVTLYSLEDAERPTVQQALPAIDDQLGVGVATPNHVLSTSPVGMCAATEPEEVALGTGPDPGICVDRGGDGVLMYIADTGLLHDATLHPWLAGVTGDFDPLTDPSHIPVYCGHGTFVAGVARCMAPACEVVVHNIFDVAGAALETRIVKALDAALGRGPDIISLSAGGTSRKDIPLLGFEGFWRRYRHFKGTVLVAAAGNNGLRRPFYPAAFPEVVSVGALAASWRSRADFSDYGPWVDVYAPGEGLVNAFATGRYTCHEPPDDGQQRQFHGMARWSGTSFSTPLVAGLIAARMSRTGESARRAADALLSTARAHPLEQVGAVLLACETGDCCAGQPGCGFGAGCCGQQCHASRR